MKARAESDPARREAIYRDGLKDFPTSVELTVNFALFMHDECKNYDEAERLYRKALELDPNNAIATDNFARFMADVGRDDEAERLHWNALELDPNNAVARDNFARFMADVRKDYDRAEELHRQALELGRVVQTNQSVAR